MAIKVSCATCEKTYQLKDEAGGKKFRCKGCQKLLPVPKPDASEPEDDWSELIEEAPEPPPIPRRRKTVEKKKASPAKTAKKRVRRAIPASVIATVVLCALGAAWWFFVAKTAAGAAGALQGPGMNLPNLQNSNGVAAIPIAWGCLDIVVLLGVLFRINVVRILGFVIDIFGMLAMLAMIVLVIIGVSMAMSNLQPGQYIRWSSVIVRIVFFLFMALIWFIDFKMLTSDETVEYVTG
jgi:hypothetical protein